MKNFSYLDKLKVVFITATGTYPKSIGGPAVFLYYLSRNLKEKNLSNINIFDFSSLKENYIFNIFRCIRNLVRCHVVFFNSPPVRTLFLFSLLAKILKKKTIFICHGGIFFESKGVLNKIIDRPLLILQLKRKIIEYSIFPSKWLLTYIKRYYKVNAKLLVIPNGVDTEELDSYSPVILPTKNNILFVGRLAKIKGISTLLEAFSHLISENCDITLYIAGPRGDLSQSELEKIIKSPHIRFLGKISHSLKLKLMKSVDLIVVPSIWENFPLVVIEAMGCAKPVIATAVGGIPEIIENGVNGILVPPFDSKLLSYYIEHLLHDKEKCSLLSRNAYKDVKQRYDWKIIANLYLNFILNILIK